MATCRVMQVAMLYGLRGLLQLWRCPNAQTPQPRAAYCHHTPARQSSLFMLRRRLSAPCNFLVQHVDPLLASALVQDYRFFDFLVRLS